MLDAAIARLLDRQDGVVSRRQVLAEGWRDHDIDRLLRRRVWARTFPGVYVAHTGPLSWEQRAWAAVLFDWPAALDARAALRAHGLRGHGCRDDAAIAVVLSHDRRPDPRPGISLRRSPAFSSEVQEHLSPPRVRLEHAILRVAAAERTEDGAVAVVGDAIQTGRTTPARLAETLRTLSRLRHRRLLAEVLDDVALGAYSALERRYLLQVERAHGLPTAARQRRVRLGSRTYYRDVAYRGLGVIVELDGRLGHDLAADRWADLDRDLATAKAGELTLRAGWGQVLQHHRLAAVVGEVLLARGWAGPLRTCSPGCPVVSLLSGGS